MRAGEKMKKTHMKIIMALLCIDQISKFIAGITLPFQEESTSMNHMIYFMNAQNYGTAFGIVEGHMFSVLIITFLSLILLFSYYHHICEDDHLSLNGILLMMSGLLGNLMDRLFLSYVRDFIAISIFDEWIILNIADIFLWVGLGMIILAQIKENQSKHTKNVQND